MFDGVDGGGIYLGCRARSLVSFLGIASSLFVVGVVHPGEVAAMVGGSLSLR